MARDIAQLEENLTRNSLGFLRRAVTQIKAAQTDRQQLAFAVVDLAVAVEVLLKARLSREHWVLILKDANKASVRSVMNGDAYTITPEDSVERLEGVAGVPLKRVDPRAGKSHATQVKELMRLRNQAAHFNFEYVDPAAIRGTLGVGLNFVLWFLRDEFSGAGHAQFTGVQHLVDDLLTEITREVGEIAEFVQARMADISDELARAEALVECPQCAQITLMIGGEDGVASCPFCEAAGNDGEEIATSYVEAVLGMSSYVIGKEGGDWPVYDCPECWTEALVEGVKTKALLESPDPHAQERAYWWGCFACGHLATVDELIQCERCGRLTGHPICPDCVASLLAD